MRSLKFLQLAIGFWCIWSLGLIAIAQPAQKPIKNILIISTEQDHIPAIPLLDRGFRESLEDVGDFKVEFFRESLDASRINGQSYEKEFVDLLRQKYKDQAIDLIVMWGRPAIAFVKRNEPILFSDVPKVYGAADQRELAQIDLGTNTVGASGKVEIGPTMELILGQNPDAKKVAVVLGAGAWDNAWRERVAQDLEAFSKRVEIIRIDPASIESVREQLAALPPGSAILFISFMADAQGRTYTTLEGLSLIGATAQHPIYAITDAAIGYNTLGGMMLSFETVGNNAGDLAEQILLGRDPSELNSRVVAALPMFDWSELQKWDIDENKLPYGSVVKFRTPTLWEQYRVYIAVAAAIMLIQAVLIGALLFTHRRRRLAEIERQQYQKVAEIEHRRTNEVVSNVPGIVWESRVIDESGRRRVQYVSGYVEEMLGYSVEECLDDPDFIISKIVEEDRATFKAEADSVLLSGLAKSIRFRCVTKSGEIKWAEARMIAIADESGTSVGLRGVTMDMTERMAAEDAIRESEGRFRDIADTAPVMIWMADDEAQVTFVDRSWMDFTGLTQTQLLGEGWLDSVHPDDRQASADVFRPAFEQRVPFSYELRLKRADGEYRWMYSSGVPRYAGEGKFAGYIGSDVDITEAKLASEAVKESGELFKNIADSAPILIWMSDTKMQCNFFNERCSEFTGRSLEDLIGEGWLESVHESDLQPMIQVYSSAYETQSPFLLEYRLRRHDGVYRWIYAVGEPRFDQKGEFLGYIGTGIDMTERREAEQSLQTALTEISGLKAALQEENIYLKEMIKLEHDFDEIIGNCDELKYVLFKIEQVAPTDATVLIAGETGTGKELVARAVHSMSSRKQRPLIKVNCAALSATLIESELFGHERGAFTGATGKKIGRFELADGGTIFLDEIGELPIELQPKLLRLIQEGEFERLGSTRTLKADVRIIAATNRDLHTEVKKGTFREDLLYRLHVFPVTVPPLRDRVADIPLLVEYFTTVFSKKMGKTITSISPAVMRSLIEYAWPGNVRELANVIERAVIGASDETLRVLEQFEIRVSSEASPVPAGSIESLESLERSHIIKALVATKWRIEGSNGAARVLGVNPSTLRSRMQKLGVSKAASQTVH